MTKLPDGFVWQTDNHDFEKIQQFLNKNNDKNKYTVDFTEWFLNTGDGYECITVLTEDKGSIVGLITGVYNKVRIDRKIVDVLDVNFLCVHKKLRGKKLTNVLIKELERLSKVESAVYSTNVSTNSFNSYQYYSRALNIDKLINSNFLSIEKDVTEQEVVNAHYLPETPSTLVEMEDKHLAQAYELFIDYTTRYNYCYYPTYEQFVKTFYNNKHVVSAVVLEDDNVVDFISYYTLQYNDIVKGFLYYYTSSTETPYRLVKDIMIMAKNKGVDVFYATDCMENTPMMLTDLLFVKQNGNNYNCTYNVDIRDMESVQICKINTTSF